MITYDLPITFGRLSRSSSRRTFVLLDEVASLDLVPEPLQRDIPIGLRIGLLGAGRIVHSGVMPAYRSVGITPVAAADPDPEARRLIRDLWGIPAVFSDWREMIDQTDLDVVDINLRWDVGLSPMRVEAVAEAARRGINVVIAKPLAETWSQCVEIVSLARDGGIKLGVDQNTRFAPAFYGCRALIRAGALGHLLSASVNYHSAVGRQHTNAFDAAHDVAVHGVDILLSWFDQEPIEVYASWSRRVDGIGSVLAAILSFADGANATIHYDFATRHRRQFEFVAVGEEASADGLQDQELPGPSRMLRASLRFGPHDPRGLAVELPLQYALSPGSYLATRLDVLQAIGTDRQPWASGENVLRTMRTLYALERSVTARTAVKIER
jgi:predicted dehydrogenase